MDSTDAIQRRSVNAPTRYPARTPEPLSPEPPFSASEMAARMATTRELLRARGLQGLLVYGAGRADDVEYLTAWPGTRESHLVVPLEAEPRLFVQLFNHAPNAARLSVVPAAWGGTSSPDSVAELLSSTGLATARVGILGPLPFQHYLRLRALCPSMELVDISAPWRALRAIRSEAEIACFRIAAEYTDRAMEALRDALKPGVTEHELAAAIEGAYRPLGGTLGIHFLASMPMEQPITGVPAQIQSGRRLAPGDVVITEVSAGSGPYTGQLHRTYFLGCEPNPTWRRIHQVALDTYQRIESVLSDGAELDRVLDAAEYVHEQGLTIFDDLLHGANQYPPIIKTRRTAHSNPSQFTFRENMVVVIQPNVVTDDAASVGLQFGETVRITSSGVERLHRLPRQYFVVPV
jgi:Xaa-Pro dipeptidase